MAKDKLTRMAVGIGGAMGKADKVAKETARKVEKAGKVAKKELAELNTGLSAGKSDGAILQGFVDEYGEKTLAEPPARGFNILAWMIPGIAFALGLAVVVGFIRYWRHRPVADDNARPALSPEMLARAHSEIDRQTSD